MQSRREPGRVSAGLAAAAADGVDEDGGGEGDKEETWRFT